MPEIKNSPADLITLGIMILSVLVPLVTFILISPEQVKTQTYIIFGIIALALIIGVFAIYIISKWKLMGKDIQTTKEDLEDIKKELNFKDLWNKMDVRLKVLENLLSKKNKKGQMVDPRIIFWIILLILLYLFLNSIGIFR